MIGQDKAEQTLAKETEHGVRTYEKELDADAADVRKELNWASDKGAVSSWRTSGPRPVVVQTR